MKADGVPPSYRLKEPSDWQLVFSSPRLDWPIERLALTARVPGGALGEHDKMVAAATGSEILLWALQPEGGGSEIGMALGLFQNSLPLEFCGLLKYPIPKPGTVTHPYGGSTQEAETGDSLRSHSEFMSGLNYVIRPYLTKTNQTKKPQVTV